MFSLGFASTIHFFLLFPFRFLLLSGLRSVRNAKNCDRGLDNAALGHSFSLYGPLSREAFNVNSLNYRGLAYSSGLIMTLSTTKIKGEKGKEKGRKTPVKTFIHLTLFYGLVD